MPRDRISLNASCWEGAILPSCFPGVTAGKRLVGLSVTRDADLGVGPAGPL